MFTLTVHMGGKVITTAIEEGQTVLSALQAAGIRDPEAPCGGIGKCGKCLAKLTGNVTPADENEKQRNPGWEEQRLVCQAKATGDCEVFIKDKDAAVATDGSHEDFAKDEWAEGCYGIAVDIGTTTVASFLYELWTGNRVAVASGLNDQRSFGADVISRSSWAMEQEGGLEQERVAIVNQLCGMAKKLCAEAGIAEEQIKFWSIAGNTIMQHIFCGLSPATIAVAPFKPLDLFGDSRSAKALGLAGSDDCMAYLPPAVAGYVGGDITAGILSQGVCTDKEPYIFLDIGTNGEIVLFNGERSYCAACAAGPAFEGAHIECGAGSLPSAINKVQWVDGKVEISTIGGVEPDCICGSGLLDALSLMLKLEVVDETGRFCDDDECSEEALPYIDADEGRFYPIPGGKVYISDKDVREIQLAKAAVAAGIDVLLAEAGISIEQVNTLYLAGGFGSNLNSQSAMDIGLIPKEMAGKIKTLGNAAGAGACASLLSADARNMLSTFDINYIELSVNKLFNNAYMDRMYFEVDD